MQKSKAASDEQRRVARAARKEGLPQHDIEGFGAYGRALRNWINGKGVTL